MHPPKDKEQLEHLCFIKHVYQSTIAEMQMVWLWKGREDCDVCSKGMFFDVFVLAFKENHVRPVVTKWATTHQGSEGGMAHWTFQKSIENKGIWQGKNSFGLQIRQQPWHVIYHFEPGHILEMDAQIDWFWLKKLKIHENFEKFVCKT